MKIESSNVSMASTHTYQKYERYESETLTVNSDKAAFVDFSEDGKSLLEQMKEVKDKIKTEDKENKQNKKSEQQKAEKNMLKNMLDQAKETGKSQSVTAKTPEDLKLETMKRILELLNRITGRDGFSFSAAREVSAAVKAFSQENSVTLMNAGNCSNSDNIFSEISAVNAENSMLDKLGAFVNEIGSNMVVGGRSLTWTKMTVQSSFYQETENTAFVSKGLVKTSDGREIDFNVTCEMSRSFQATYENFTAEKLTVAFKDPLVINYSGNPCDVSDQKFMFDLDADGKEESISELKEGSGYLALDKNGDGKINDGSELFGTKTGDGFRELAAYDEDGNGWIDENDSVFKKLKIWTKDENGTSKLVDLKKADVGAIYLGNADTEFSLNGAGNKTNGMIRKTGVFLKESGGAGTVQHLDLAV